MPPVLFERGWVMKNYGSIEGADAYHAARGNAGWIGDTVAKAAALLVASEVLDAEYGGSFPGRRVAGRRQEREWPRNWAVDHVGDAIASDAVPIEVENATYELALRHIRKPGSLSVDFVPNKIIRQAAVPGAVSVTYGGSGNASDQQLVVPIVDAILAPIMGTAAGFSSLSGTIVRGS